MKTSTARHSSVFFSEEEVDKLRNVAFPKEKNEMHFLNEKNIQF